VSSAKKRRAAEEIQEELEVSERRVCRVGTKTLFIEPGSPWENGYIESFTGKLRDELLNGELFDTVNEARVITERWRKHYNTRRPHSSLEYRPPAPGVRIFPQVATA